MTDLKRARWWGSLKILGAHWGIKNENQGLTGHYK